MNNPDDLLSFLVAGLPEKQRDLVTRSFYKFAQGDPESGPVNEAVLLTAVSRQVALAPKELRAVLMDLAKMLAAIHDTETRVQDRVERSNVAVVTSFKDEANRATSGLRATAQHSELIVNEGRLIAATTRKLHIETSALLAELRLLKGELKNHADAGRSGKVFAQFSKEIISALTDVACVNWICIGVLSGFVLAYLALQLQFWLAVTALVCAIGTLHWIGRASWEAVKRKAETIKAGSSYQRLF